LRKLYIHGEINDAAFSEFSKNLDALVAQSAEPIIVELSSHGGESEAGLAFYGKIRACPCLIYVEAYGQVQSAATIILAAADYRSCGLDLIFMVHDSPRPRKKSDLVEWERQEQQWAEILELHSVVDAKEWRKMSKKTTYLNPAQCLQFGVIDQIMKGTKHK
jgi:ATP-dependent protease ClpP protease subunit